MYLSETGNVEEDTQAVVSYFTQYYAESYLLGFVSGWDSSDTQLPDLPASQLRQYRQGHTHGRRCWMEVGKNVQTSLART